MPKTLVGLLGTCILSIGGRYIAFIQYMDMQTKEKKDDALTYSRMSSQVSLASYMCFVVHMLHSLTCYSAYVFFMCFVLAYKHAVFNHHVKIDDER